MGRSADPASSDYYEAKPPLETQFANELPEHEAYVDTFALDKYEVTVGRFRQFVEAYDVWHGGQGNPKVGDGAHPAIPGTGWAESWTPRTGELPSDAAELRKNLNCSPASQTWTDQAGANEA